MSSAEILLLSAIEDNDELVLISTEMNQSHGNVYNGEKNNLEVLTNEQCRLMFRFEKQDIDRLRVALGIPPKIVCNNGTVASGIEGICIVLRRLSYPNRLEDISPIFQRPLYELSYILSKTLDIIYDNTSQKLTSLDQEWLSEEYIRTFAENHIVGVYRSNVDTLRPIRQVQAKPRQDRCRYTKEYYRRSKRMS
ncbi:unnamed protein product [Mytilus coruscus]|uniref:Uncharacterized protein n=1 Tax=Mytilus coruscus TaxID=42192 RepID=A0A6J8AXK5_MYTCO|nr:unnamed protein product [Mytilus coruscus]